MGVEIIFILEWASKTGIVGLNVATDGTTAVTGLEELLNVNSGAALIYEN